MADWLRQRIANPFRWVWFLL